MSYSIIHDGQHDIRHLSGPRTLAEILTEAESTAFAQGKLVALNEYNGLLTLSSPLEIGAVITLRPPTSEDINIFKVK